MKKSYMDERLIDLGVCAGQRWLILAEMEFGGVVWDPEEEPLPEKIQAYRAGKDWFLAPDDSDWSTPEQKAAAYREAVRRWNAWKELDRLSSSNDPNCFLEYDVWISQEQLWRRMRRIAAIVSPDLFPDGKGEE